LPLHLRLLHLKMSDNLRRSTRRSKKRAYSVGDMVEIEVSRWFGTVNRSVRRRLRNARVFGRELVRLESLYRFLLTLSTYLVC
jgi:hypothetical protein